MHEAAPFGHYPVALPIKHCMEEPLAHTADQLYIQLFKGLGDPTPDTPTTADDFVTRVKSAVGKTVLNDDCHALTLAAAKAAGASLPGGWGWQDIKNTGPAAVSAKFASNTAWYQAYRGDLYELDWTNRSSLASYLKAGDVIRAHNGYSYHTMTVTSVSASDIKIVDNVGARDENGYIFVTEHSLFDFPKLDDNTASVIRLRSSGGGLIQPPAIGATPQLSVGDVQGSEGGGVLSFKITLNQTASEDVTFNAYTYAGTARVTTTDYKQVNKFFTIKAGSSSTTVEVPIIDDSRAEANETFELRVRNVKNATVKDGAGIGTIIDNDGGGSSGSPQLTVKDVTVNEGGRTARVTVSLDRAATSAVTFSAATYMGTANAAAGDYAGFTNKSGRIEAGARTATISVSITDDKTVEGAETFGVGVFDVVGAEVAQARGTVTIVDNDKATSASTIPKISISDASVTEGGTADFKLSLSSASSSDVIASLTTYRGTANKFGGPADYSGFIDRRYTIAAGQTSITVPVSTIDDTLREGTESFAVEIANVTGASIARRRASGTITDNDVSGMITRSGPVSSSGTAAAASASAGTVEKFGSYTLPGLDPEWQVATAADFDGDGYGDLVLRNQNDGRNAIWFMEGENRVDGLLLPDATNLEWEIAGAADMNLDGNVDLLWRNDRTGESAAWLMNGASCVATEQLRTTSNTDWRIGGVADMNGDESPDLLWRNQTTGENAVWLMDGTDFVEAFQLPATSDPSWQMVGTGDCNEDGANDVVWHNRSTGVLAYWTMDGLNQTGSGILDATSDVNWDSVAVSGMDGVGGCDIIWRNTVTGGNAVWSLGTPVTNG